MALELPSPKCKLDGTTIRLGCASSQQDCPKDFGHGIFDLACFDPALKNKPEKPEKPIDAETAIVEIANILHRLNKARADC